MAYGWDGLPILLNRVIFQQSIEKDFTGEESIDGERLGMEIEG